MTIEKAFEMFASYGNVSMDTEALKHVEPTDQQLEAAAAKCYEAVREAHNLIKDYYATN